MIMKDSNGIACTFGDWTAHVWPGNPDLVREAYVKSFKNHLNNGRKLNIWVWRYYDEDYMFTVSAGVDSDYSYSGRAPKEYQNDAKMTMAYIDNNINLVIK